MSWAVRYRAQADRQLAFADRRDAAASPTMATIARHRAETYARLAATASRWERMAALPLAERPGGFPGDPFNSTKAA